MRSQAHAFEGVFGIQQPSWHIFYDAQTDAYTGYKLYSESIKEAKRLPTSLSVSLMGSLLKVHLSGLDPGSPFYMISLS